MSLTSPGSNGGSNGPDQLDLSLMDEVFAQYADQQGALIPVLQKAQSLYGYLPPEVLKLIAGKQGVSVGKVYGVATFYAQFYLEKRGKHVLKVCDGTACHVKGATILMTALEEEFGIKQGETTEDGELTVEVVYCVGSCALAPLAVFDDEVIGRTKQSALIKHVKKQIGG